VVTPHARRTRYAVIRIPAQAHLLSKLELVSDESDQSTATSP
jgi:hypothetical protein